MLGISPIGSASATAEYFAKDNYYNNEEAKDNSTWLGKGAEDLGLKGAVDDKAFLEVLKGKFGDTQFGKENHNPGRDLTFSMPKSASVLALVGGDKRITKAYMKAVTEGIQYAEKHLIVTRQRNEDGTKSSVKTGNIIAAMFGHSTSRAKDPNAHIHVIIANGTKDKNGDYKAVNFFPLYSVRYELNQIVAERFRNELHKMGYQTVDKDKGGHFEIVGVPKTVTSHFSTRHQQIHELLKGVSEPSWGQRQQAAYQQRPGKGTIEQTTLVQKWKQEAKEKGFDPEQFVNKQKAPTTTQHWQNIKTKVFEMLGKRYPTVEAPTFQDASVSNVTEFAIKALSETSTTIKRSQIVAEVMAITQGSFGLETVNKNIDQIQTNKDLVPYKTDKYAGNVFTTKTSILAEKNIISQMQSTQDLKPLYKETRLSAELMVKAAEKLSYTEHADGTKSGQLEAVKSILFDKGYITGVQGYAGTGKTTMLASMKQIAAELNKHTDEKHSFIGLAPTTPATDELRQKLDKSSTFQKFQHETHYLSKGLEPTKEHMDKYSGKTIILDETSMISVKEMSKFIEATKQLGVRKIVLMGDVDQIKSLKSGATFLLMQAQGMKTAIVDTIFRQNPNQKIKDIVIDVIHHDTAGAFEKLKDNKYITSHKDPLKAIAKDYVEKLKAENIRHSNDPESDKKEIGIITPTNAAVKEITANVRDMLLQEKILDVKQYTLDTMRSLYLSDLEKKVIKSYKIGDNLVFQKSTANDKFVRGESYKITNIDTKRNVISLVGAHGQRRKWVLDSRVANLPFDVMKDQKNGFSKGDQVKFSIADKSKNIERNQTGVITKIDGKSFTVENKDGSTVTLSNRSPTARGLNHNYASTAHATQGRSIDITLVAMTGKAFSSTFENFYVAVSRAKEYLHIFTNNTEDLEKTIKQDSSSYTEHAIDFDKSQIEEAAEKKEIKDMREQKIEAKDTAREDRDNSSTTDTDKTDEKNNDNKQISEVRDERGTIKRDIPSIEYKEMEPQRERTDRSR